MIVAGRNPVMDLLASNDQVDKLFVQSKLKGENLSQIKRKAHALGIPINLVPKIKLDKLFNGSHQGVIAIKSLIKYYDYNDIIQHSFEKGLNPLFVLLDGITDVRNFGAIARTALGMNVDAIIIMSKHSAPINADAIKTSAGALNKLPICRVNSTAQALEDFKLNGFNIVGIDVAGKGSIDACQKGIPTVIVMGAEDKGIRKENLDLCDEVFSIPISKQMESYNVSVAMGMVLYEFNRA